MILELPEDQKKILISELNSIPEDEHDEFRKAWVKNRFEEIYSIMCSYETEFRKRIKKKFSDYKDPIMQRLIPTADRDRAVLLARKQFYDAMDEMNNKQNNIEKI